LLGWKVRFIVLILNQRKTAAITGGLALARS
jgi:hypothetical protein